MHLVQNLKITTTTITIIVNYKCMEMLSVPLFTQAKSNPATLCNGSNVSTDSRKRGNCTKGTRKPRDNVLLGNGSACYRRVAQKTPLTGTAFIKVVHCAAKKDLLKCILTVDDIAGGKAFKNTQKVFRAGDRITIIHSRVYEEYSSGQVTSIQPHRMFGRTTTTIKTTTTTKEAVSPSSKSQNVQKKRQYGRKEKDSSNVWFVVTTAKHGRSRLWQRNMELLRLFLEFGDVEYVEVETAAVGMARDLARVYHSKGGDQHTCYQVQMTPGTALWIDETLFYTKVVGCEETKEQAKEEEDFFKTPEKEEEERDSRAEEETAEAVKSNECKECTDWTIWNCYELWDMFHEEETM